MEGRGILHPYSKVILQRERNTFNSHGFSHTFKSHFWCKMKLRFNNEGRVSSDDEKCVCSCGTRIQREHIQEFQLFHEKVSEASERAREWSKRAKQAERSRALQSK